MICEEAALCGLCGHQKYRDKSEARPASRVETEQHAVELRPIGQVSRSSIIFSLNAWS